ncbi:unnamed protein product, partial [Parascedosporium putredinis]
MPAFQLGWY